MRTALLLRSLAALSVLSAPLLSAHATTYTFTPTLVDLTTPSNITATFGTGSGPFSFNDPPNSFIVDSLTVAAKDGSDGDELALNFAFTAPGTGTASITGDVEITGRRNILGEILWDSTSNTITLSNGSVVRISVPDDTFSLSSCGEDEDCICPQGSVCGSTDVTVSVRTNDPPMAPTPEPSSLALLGTGVLSLAGLVRRRITA